MKKRMFVLLLLVCLIFTGCCISTGNETLTLAENKDRIQGLEYAPTDEISTAYFNKITVEIEKVTYKNKVGTATVMVHFPDLQMVINNAAEQAYAANENADYETMLAAAKANLVTIMNGADCPMVQEELTMEAFKKEKTVYLICNEQFTTIVSGHLDLIFTKILAEGV